MTLIGAGFLSPNRAHCVPVSAESPHLQDLVLEYPCRDGAALWPVLTDAVAGNNATIYAASPAETYPGGRLYPYFDGINDYAACSNNTIGNFAGSFAVSFWADIKSYPTYNGAFVVKGSITTTPRQWAFYHYAPNFRFQVSRTGTSATSTIIAFTAPGSGMRFYCLTYEYLGDGASKMRIFSDRGTGTTLYQEAQSDVAVGPAFATAYPVTLAKQGWGSGSFVEEDVLRLRLFGVDAARAAAWTDGTYPALELAMGSGQ